MPQAWKDAPVVEEPAWKSAPAVDAADPGVPSLGTPEYTDRDTWGKNTILDDVGEVGRDAADMGKDALAVGEFALTAGTAGLSSIAGGFGETIKTLFGKSLDDAANDLNQGIQDFTYEPKTERGKQLLDALAKPLITLDSGITDISEIAGFGNPIATTAIKTTLLGGLELAIPGKTAITGVRARSIIAKQQKKVKATAKRLNIDLDPKNLEASVLDSARKMAPDVKGQHALELQSAIQAANRRAKARRFAAYEVAKTKKAFVNTAPVRKMANDLDRVLDLDGFDLGHTDMLAARRNIDALRSGAFSKDSPVVAIHLRELEKIRRRTLQKTGIGNDSLIEANTRIRHAIDGLLDDQFNQGMIRGDATAIQAWKDARAAHATWKNNFMANKTIKKLVVDLEATPEQINDWVLGATATGAKKEAAATIRRIRTVLGDNHPSIEGMRQDFLFNVAEPLLKETPNFGQFLRNYDLTVRKNPSIVRELGLKQSDMSQLRNFVAAQQRLPASARQTLDLYRAISQFSVGHQIAKAGLRVRVAESIARIVAGADKVTKKRIIAELAGATFDQPVVPPNSRLAAEFITAAALPEIAKITDE